MEAGRPRPAILAITGEPFATASMTTANITPDGDTILAEVFIAAPPERVFAALTDPRQMLEWWGQKGMYRCTQFHTDVRPGGKWRRRRK